MTTHFHDFIRDNGLRITVEYTASAGESNFDYPGHICDGGGCGPEVEIVDAWPNTPGYNRIQAWAFDLCSYGHGKGWIMRVACALLSLPLQVACCLDVRWRASLTTDER